MKDTQRNITRILVLLLVFLLSTGAEAKWWIFGQSDAELDIEYLYLNKASFDETGAKVTIYRETLPDGKITISGKASAKNSRIGSVRVSTDGREVWNDATLSEGGAFEYSFRPEVGKPYAIYVEVSDTTGKTNDVKSTYREVTVSDRNITAIIKEVLDKLIEAYKNHDARGFMSLVSDDFAGDAANLDRAIRKDFSSFDNIDLRYTFNNVTSDAKGISVSLNFSRWLTSTRSGQSLTDRGMTEFIFKQGEKGPKVFSMKNPLIFGVTNAANVATGTVRPVTSDPIIIVDGSGNATKVSAQLFVLLVMDDSLRITNNPDGTSTIRTTSTQITVDRNGNQTGGGGIPSVTVEQGTRTLVSAGHPPAGFTFVDGQLTVGAGDFVVTGGMPGTANGWLGAGVTLVDLGAQALRDVREAPASGYTTPVAVTFVEGHSYAFKLASGKYGLMEVLSVTEAWPAGILTITMRFSYKYQPSGARQFLP